MPLSFAQCPKVSEDFGKLFFVVVMVEFISHLQWIVLCHDCVGQKKQLLLVQDDQRKPMGQSVGRTLLGWNFQQWYLQGSELRFCHLDILLFGLLGKEEAGEK